MAMHVITFNFHFLYKTLLYLKICDLNAIKFTSHDTIFIEKAESISNYTNNM